MIETMKQALEALEKVKRRAVVMGSTGDYREGQLDALKVVSEDVKPAIASLQQAIAELESQEPVGWHLIEALYPQGERLDIRMGDGSILCNLLPQADGDLWWEGSGTGEKFIDPVYADVTHWRIHSNTHPPQRTWQGLTKEQLATTDWSADFRAGALWAEAKLKERNT